MKKEIRKLRIFSENRFGEIIPENGGIEPYIKKVFLKEEIIRDTTYVTAYNLDGSRFEEISITDRYTTNYAQGIQLLKRSLT